VAAGTRARRLRMVEVDGCPVRRDVTGLALTRRCKMAGRFPRRGTAVVAARAASGDDGMVEVSYSPRTCFVARLAWSSCHQVIGRLPARGPAIVTGHAAADRLRMIEAGHCPEVRRRMAIRAIVRRCDMVLLLARSTRSVVAGTALDRRRCIVAA
jgi:hypothetical protein